MTARSDTTKRVPARGCAPALRAGGRVSSTLPLLLLCLWPAPLSAATAPTAPPSPPACTAPACHGPMIKLAHVHAPAAEGCESCHEATGSTHPDSASVDFRLAASEGALCAQCHEPFPGKASRHAPVAEGQCLTCHDPHASAEPRLLRRALNEQCFECHDREAFRVHAIVGVDLGGSHPTSGGADPARNGERFTCASCHEAHASDSPFLWRFGARETFDLCGNCHAK